MRWPRIYRKFQFNLFDWDLVVKLNRPTVSPAPWLKTLLLPQLSASWAGLSWEQLRWDARCWADTHCSGRWTPAWGRCGAAGNKTSISARYNWTLRCTGPGLMLYCPYWYQLRLLQTLSVSTSKSPPSSLHRVPRSQEPVTRILRVRLQQIIMRGRHQFYCASAHWLQHCGTAASLACSDCRVPTPAATVLQSYARCGGKEEKSVDELTRGR